MRSERHKFQSQLGQYFDTFIAAITGFERVALGLDTNRYQCKASAVLKIGKCAKTSFTLEALLFSSRDSSLRDIKNQKDSMMDRRMNAAYDRDESTRPNVDDCSCVVSIEYYPSSAVSKIMLQPSPSGSHLVHAGKCRVQADES